MFTWDERLHLAKQFAKRPTVKGISSIGSHKATFSTVTGSESHDYFYLQSISKPELPGFLQKLIKDVFAWQAKA